MLKHLSYICCVALLLTAVSAPAQWRPVGPYGGNARSLARDPLNPDHILLGSGAGALFESTDGGRQWKHFAHLGPGDELMLESIAFDPSRLATIYVAGWSVTGSGGGFFLTRDGGRSWSEPAALRGKSIQALALANVPGLLIVGALDGLYRTCDWGETWVRISPAGHSGLKNVESVAVDPHNPEVIYAGTWHLPWKTTDGGLHWKIIKQGVIDDSDVFSILLDRANPHTVFASACSGIYKSENSGELFHKVQGIPGTARRTRVLQQDPADADTVYAGTTEGLWKTTDGGKSFKLISPPNFILNGVLVDPRDSRRVLIATDRGGVFASDDAGLTFSPSNTGFSQRQISTLFAAFRAADSPHDSDIYAAVLNDKEFGGVFRAHNGTWSQLSQGLGGLDVFDLAQSPSGQLVAATNRGLFLLDASSQRWAPSRVVIEMKSPFQGRASALALGRHWYAATDSGVLVSENEGKSWRRRALEGSKGFVAISCREQTVAAATLRTVWYSRDDGEHWSRRPLPPWITRIYSVAIASDGVLWMGTREGAFHWTARGWEHALNGLAPRDVTSIRVAGIRVAGVRPAGTRVDDDTLLASAASNLIYVSQDNGRSWKAEPAADFEVTGAVLQNGALYVSTRHHGLLVRDADSSQGLH